MMIKRFDTTAPKDTKKKADIHEQENTEENKRKHPMSKQCSRNTIDKIHAVHNPPPPLGVYNPKIVKKKVPV